MTFLSAHSFKKLDVKPVWHLYIAFVPLLEVDGEPEWNLDRLTWSEGSIAATYECELVSLKARHNFNDTIFGKELIFCWRPAPLIHHNL